MSEELEPCKGCGHPECNTREMHERVHASIGKGRVTNFLQQSESAHKKHKFYTKLPTGELIPLVDLPRPQVMQLALLMEQKLRRDDDTKPDWNQSPLHLLMKGLDDELDELYTELRKLSQEDEICLGQLSIASIPNAKAIALECADAANYLMFIADKVGGLE